MVKLAATAVFGLLVGAASGSRVVLQANNAVEECPIRPASTPLDFKKVAQQCDASNADFCNLCVCSMVEAYAPAFAAANVTIANPATFDPEAAAFVITKCTQDYYNEMLLANVKLESLQKLSDCDFEGGAAPTCLTGAATAAVAPGATGDNEFFKDDNEKNIKPQPVGALAVASVQPVQGSAFVTLSGQASDISELVKLLTANAEVKAAMKPEDFAVLEGLVADPTKMATIKAEVMTTLSNPFDVKMFVSQVSPVVSQAGPSQPPAQQTPATPAPTPAPKNSASSAVLSALPMVGSTLVAVLMLASMI